MSGAVPAGVIDGTILCAPLAFLVWCVLRCCRRMVNAATRYAIWWIMLVVAMILPLSLVYSPGFAAPSGAEPAAEPVLHVPEVNQPAAVPLSRQITFAFGVWAGRVFGLWIATSFLLLVRLCISYFLLQRRKTAARPPSAQFDATVRELLDRCGIRRKVRVGIVTGTASPMVAGPIDACILIPESLLAALDSAELEQVCLHEAAHLARFDDCALLVQRLAELLFVFCPAVLWIARQLDLEREIACDDFVIAFTGQPHVYASCLTRVAEFTGRVGSPVAAAATDETSHLTRRIDMLLNKTRHAGTRLLRWRFAAFSAALLALTTIAIRAPRLFALAAQERQETVAARTPAPDSRAGMVRVPIDVSDPQSRYVTGLSSDDFRIFDNGIEQQIFRFSSADAPVSICVIWDVNDNLLATETMIGELNLKLERLLISYKPDHPDVKRLKEQLLQWEERRDTQTKSAQAAMAVIGNWSASDPGNQTKLFRVHGFRGRAELLGSLQETIARINSGRNERTAIITVSGYGYGLVRPAEDINAITREAGLPVYSIAVAGHPDSDEAGGGEDVTAGGWQNAPNALQRLIVRMRNQYVLDYSPKSAGHKGEYHRIQVTVATPRGLLKLEVRHRAGYFAPAP